MATEQIDKLVKENEELSKRKSWAELFSGASQRFILGSLIIGGTFAIVYFLIFHEVPERNKDAFNILLGGLITVVTLTTKYFFERSKDYSDDKKIEQANKLSNPDKPNV